MQYPQIPISCYESMIIRSQESDQDLGWINSSTLEFRDLGLKITTLPGPMPLLLLWKHGQLMEQSTTESY